MTTEKKASELVRSHVGPPDATEESSDAEARQSGAFARKTLYRPGLGIVLPLVLAAMAFVIFGQSQGSLADAVHSSRVAQERLPDPAPALSDRTDCDEIGSSDLRLPSEGLWFQSNCLTIPELPLMASTTNCNRTSLNASEFIEVSPGLHVFRQTESSRAYLWYATSEVCFDLVSDRVVTAICTDQAVSFSWETSVCSENGGVLAWVNGRSN